MIRALLVVVLGLAACSSAQSPGSTRSGSVEFLNTMRPGHIQRVEMTTSGAAAVGLAGAPERVWAVLPEVYAGLGLSGSVLDSAQFVYGQTETTVRRRLLGGPVSRLVDCGERAGISNADTYAVRIVIRTQVLADGPEASQVRTLVEASARDPGSSDPWVRCGSRNVLEGRIEAALRERLAAG